MLWCAMCRMVYVYATLSSLTLSSQPVCAWVGWHRCLTVCTYAHIVQTIDSTALIIIIIIIIHTIQYIYYNYTHTKYDICLHYTVSCEEVMLYTNSCIYYSYTICICMLYPLWYMTMYITSHTMLIYYNNYYYDNSNSYLFLFLLLCCCMCVCMRVCVVLCCLSLLCMCALLCVLAYAHTCVSVCVYPASPSQTVLWWRGWCVDIGGVYFGKKFLQNLENGYTR